MSWRERREDKEKIEQDRLDAVDLERQNSMPTVRWRIRLPSGEEIEVVAEHYANFFASKRNPRVVTITRHSGVPRRGLFNSPTIEVFHGEVVFCVETKD